MKALVFGLFDKVDVETRTLSGLFNQVAAILYPDTIDRFTVYMALTDVSPDTNPSFRLQVTDFKGETIAETEPMAIQSQTPIQIHHIVVEMKDLLIGSPGRYTIRAILGGEPFAECDLHATYVALEPQHYSQDDLPQLLADPDVVKRMRLGVRCNSCNHEYVFEESLDPNAPISDGCLPFPESGIFVCPNDGTEVNFTGVKAQVRALLGRKRSEIPQMGIQVIR